MQPDLRIVEKPGYGRECSDRTHPELKFSDFKVRFQKGKGGTIHNEADYSITDTTVVVLLLGVAAFGEDCSKTGVAIFYSYARFNPSHAYVPNAFSLNGGGGSVDYKITRYIGLEGEFAGYGSNTQRFSYQGVTGNVQANLFTYMFGPQIGLRTGKIRPFGHVLLGGAHSNGSANIYRAIGSVGVKPSNDAFALAFGGGIDIPVNHSGTVVFRRADINYLWTNFNLNSHQSGQSNFQYKAGIVFNF